MLSQAGDHLGKDKAGLDSAVCELNVVKEGHISFL